MSTKSTSVGSRRNFIKHAGIAAGVIASGRMLSPEEADACGLPQGTQVETRTGVWGQTHNGCDAMWSLNGAEFTATLQNKNDNTWVLYWKSFGFQIAGASGTDYIKRIRVSIFGESFVGTTRTGPKADHTVRIDRYFQIDANGYLVADGKLGRVLTHISHNGWGFIPAAQQPWIVGEQLWSYSQDPTPVDLTNNPACMFWDFNNLPYRVTVAEARSADFAVHVCPMARSNNQLFKVVGNPEVSMYW